MYNGQWMRKEGDLLQRYDLSGLTGGILSSLTQSKDIEVPQNCLGLVFQGGRLLETLQPGRHRAGPSEGGWLKRLVLGEGKPSATEIIYVFAGETELACSWGGDQAGAGAVFSANNMPCQVRGRLVVTPSEPERFALNGLEAGRETLTARDLAAMTQGRFLEVIRRSARQEPLLEQTHFARMHNRLEHALTDEMPEFWSGRGLQLVRIAQLDVTSTAAEQFVSKQADLEAREGTLGLRQREDKVKRGEMQADHLFQILTTKDSVEKDGLLRELEKKNILSKREMDLLRRGLNEEDEDYKLARDMFVAKTKLLQGQELEDLDKQFGRKQEKEDVLHTEDIENIRTDGGLGRKIKEADADVTIRQKVADADYYEGMKGLEILKGTKAVSREDELERATHKAKLIAELSQHGMAALLAGLDDDNRARMVVELAKSEGLAKMTEEQILAQAAAGSPEVARAFQEKFKALGGARIEDMYKQMSENEGKFRQELLTMFNMSSSTQRDASVGVAQGAGGAARGPFGVRNLSADTLLCTNCSTMNPETANFCGNCGHRLRGKE